MRRNNQVIPELPLDTQREAEPPIEVQAEADASDMEEDLKIAGTAALQEPLAAEEAQQT